MTATTTSSRSNYHAEILEFWEDIDPFMAELFEVMQKKEDWIIDPPDDDESQRVIELVEKVVAFIEEQTPEGFELTINQLVKYEESTDVKALIDLLLYLSTPVSMRLLRALFQDEIAREALVDWLSVYSEGGEPETTNLYARLSMIESFDFLTKMFDEDNWATAELFLEELEE